MMDLTTLSEYDSIICVDRSGSMGDPTTRFASRWKEAEELTAGLAAFASKVDTDGITLIAFGGTFKPDRDVQDGVDAKKVRELFARMNPGGSTPLDAALGAAFSKKFSSSKKAVIFVITDGVPDDQSAVKKQIIGAASKLSEGNEIKVQFIQVGDDASAKKYLDGLDNDLSGAKFDIVNVVGYEEANGLTPEELYERAITDSH